MYSATQISPDAIWSLNALLIVIAVALLFFLIIFLTNKRAGKKRYAELQAKRAAEGASKQSSALSEIENANTRSRFGEGDG